MEFIEKTGSLMTVSDTEPSLVLLALPVLLGGLMALGGTVYGKWSERHREHEVWLRDRRLDAYTRLIAALNDARQSSLRLLSRETEEGREYEANQLAEAMAPMERLVAEVRLLGPDDVKLAADRAVSEARSLVVRVHDHVKSSAPGEMIDESASNAAGGAWSAFLEEATKVIQESPRLVRGSRKKRNDPRPRP